MCPVRGRGENGDRLWKDKGIKQLLLCIGDVPVNGILCIPNLTVYQIFTVRSVCAAKRGENLCQLLLFHFLLKRPIASEELTLLIEL